MPIPTVKLFSQQEHGHLLPVIAAIHAACIVHDQTTATFLPPLKGSKIQKFWEGIARETDLGTRFICILLNESEPGTKAKELELVGVVTLGMPFSETGSFRGFVEKLFVSPTYRGRGGARALMCHLEAEALKRGKTLMVCTNIPKGTSESSVTDTHIVTRHGNWEPSRESISETRVYGDGQDP